jgi:hypothetical protein
MFRTKLNILAGIVLIGSTVTAYAEPVCSNGTIGSGATQTLTYNLDASMRSHFTLESDQQDVVLEIADDAGNVACVTSLPNPGYQTCGWQPAEGATYTAKILRPLPTTVANASDAAIPEADDDSQSNNVGQGSPSDASVADENTTATTEQVVLIEAAAMAPDANYTLCSDQSE